MTSTQWNPQNYSCTNSVAYVACTWLTSCLSALPGGASMELHQPRTQALVIVQGFMYQTATFKSRKVYTTAVTLLWCHLVFSCLHIHGALASLTLLWLYTLDGIIGCYLTINKLTLLSNIRISASNSKSPVLHFLGLAPIDPLQAPPTPPMHATPTPGHTPCGECIRILPNPADIMATWNMCITNSASQINITSLTWTSHALTSLCAKWNASSMLVPMATRPWLCSMSTFNGIDLLRSTGWFYL